MARDGVETMKGEEALILALAAGGKVAEAARRSGVSVRTAHRRLESPEFRFRVASARDAMFARATGSLAAGADDAAATLRKLLKSKSESIQLAAARAIFEYADRMRQAVDAETRLAELERKVFPQQGVSEA